MRKVWPILLEQPSHLEEVPKQPLIKSVHASTEPSCKCLPTPRVALLTDTILWMHGGTQPIPVSKGGMLLFLTNQGMGSHVHCRAPVCPVSARHSFYYGRINKTGIARESGEGQQREGSQRHYTVYIVVFLCMCPETQTFGQK